jgi:hypothetical protein
MKLVIVEDIKMPIVRESVSADTGNSTGLVTDGLVTDGLSADGMVFFELRVDPEVYRKVEQAVQTTTAGTAQDSTTMSRFELRKWQNGYLFLP